MLGRVVRALVVGCGCVGKLVGTSPCVGLNFPVRPPWLSHWLAVGWSALCWMSCLDRVLVRQVGTFPKLSLWLASLDGCVCDIEQKMASVTSEIHVLTSFNLGRRFVAWAGWVVLS